MSYSKPDYLKQGTGPNASLLGFCLLRTNPVLRFLHSAFQEVQMS